jgi:hypothetical protein
MGNSTYRDSRRRIKGPIDKALAQLVQPGEPAENILLKISSSDNVFAARDDQLVNKMIENFAWVGDSFGLC